MTSQVVTGPSPLVLPCLPSLAGAPVFHAETSVVLCLWMHPSLLAARQLPVGVSLHPSM